MQNSDLVETLSILGEEERDLLLFKYEKSSNRRSDSLYLLRHISACLKTEKAENLRKEKVYAILFPNEEIVENKLEKLMGKTLSLVRKFMAVQAFERQMSNLQQIHYLQLYYKKRNLETQFWSASRLINKESLNTTQDFYARFLCENQAFIQESTRNKRKDDLNIQKTIRALDEYYLIERLWLMCGLLIQVQVAPVDVPPLQDWALFDFSAPNLRWFFDKPLGQLFTKSIALLSNTKGDNPKELQEFVNLLHQFESDIIPVCVDLFEVSACNYGIRQINKGNAGYIPAVFELQQKRVESGRIYLNTNLINAAEFQSILSIAFRLQKFEWVKNFIETHKKKVLGIMSSQQYHEFALANYLFHTKDYQETCRILMTSDYDDIQCKISGRILEIKALSEQCFREKGDHRIGEYLEDRVEAAILFFFRQKDLEATKKKMGKKFADTMKRIIHAEGKRDAERLDIILQDIGKAEFIAERLWLAKLTEDLIAAHRKK